MTRLQATCVLTLKTRLSKLSLVETMKTVNIHEAKTRLSKLVDEASRGEPFVIAKAGKPIVKVTALQVPIGSEIRRLGFMAGQISVPEDFDRMGSDEIERIFGGRE
jgi:prevent-host-death family protein